MKYIIPGNPIPLARPRIAQRGMWDDQKKQRIAFGLYIHRLHGNNPPYTGPLSLDITFYMKLPLSKRDRKALTIQDFHIFKPDIDNLIKFVCDACTGVLFTDDCIVSTIIATKRYDSEPRTEFTIRSLKDSK